MKTPAWALSMFPLLLLVAAGCNVQVTRTSVTSRTTPEIKVELHPGGTTGTWSCSRQAWDRLDREWVQITFREGGSQWSYGISPGRLRPVKTEDGESRVLVLQGPLGVFTMEGVETEKRLSGRYQYEPAAEAQALNGLFDPPPNTREWMILTLAHLTPEEVRAYAREERQPSEVIRLAQHGIQPGYLRITRELQFAKTSEDAIRLRNHGMGEDLLRGFRAADTSLNADQVIRLRNHGVSPSLYGDFRRLDKGLQPDAVIRLRNHGVNPDYYEGWMAQGFGPEEIIRLRNYGVPPDYARAVRSAGLQGDADQVIRLRNHGVPADFINATRAAGYSFTAEELIRLRNSGVSADYLAALQVPGRKSLAPEVIIDLRNRGVPIETVRKLREQ